jgi:hypothetical protein
VIECWATERAEVANVATPEPFKVPVPIVVAPSLNVTVPVGATEPVESTAAVKVTIWPESDGLTLEVNVVLVPV